MTHGRVSVTVLVCLPPDTLGQFPVHRIRPEFVRHTDDVLLSQLHSLIEHLFHEFEGICTVVVPLPTLDDFNPAVPQIGRESCRERACEQRVELGGRRIIKNNTINTNSCYDEYKII